MPTRPDLRLPVRVFGDSQLLIRFMLRIYKRPQRHSIYWAIEDVKRTERDLGGPVAYRHVSREANVVADDMARRALTERGDVTFWAGQTPDDAPANQLQDVYAQQGLKPKLTGVELPPVVAWDRRAPASVAAAFGLKFAARLQAATLRREQALALERLREVVDLRTDSCLAS